MNKFVRNTTFALLGATFAMSVMAAPMASAHASDVKTTVKSYDMDEYLDMLITTGQYDKYDRFAKIADAQSWDKHISRYTVWRSGYPVAYDLSDPVYALKLDAKQYGFDAAKDQFRLVSKSGDKAWVRITHSGNTYYANMLHSEGGWYINAVYRVGK